MARAAETLERHFILSSGLSQWVWARPSGLEVGQVLQGGGGDGVERLGPIRRRVRGLLPSLRLPGGVAVAALAPTPQSSDEGLAAGDIITTINGTLIASLSDPREAIDAFKPGAACVLQVQRGTPLRFVALDVS